AWLAGRYPGAFPARRRPGLAWWGARTAARGLVEAARGRDRDRALWAVLEPLEQVTFELGRSLPNTRPPGGGSRRPARPGAPGGAPDPGSLPVPAVAADLAVAAVRLRLLAIRAARPGSLLVHRGAIERWGPPPGGGDDLVWTARLLRGRWGVLVPGSVAVRAA